MPTTLGHQAGVERHNHREVHEDIADQSLKRSGEVGTLAGVCCVVHEVRPRVGVETDYRDHSDTENMGAGVSASSSVAPGIMEEYKLTEVPER